MQFISLKFNLTVLVKSDICDYGDHEFVVICLCGGYMHCLSVLYPLFISNVWV